MKVSKLKNQKILILGFAREGIATLNFLNKHLPDQKISVADKTPESDLSKEAIKALNMNNVAEKYFGKNYLEKVSAYDVIIKSPGVAPNIPEIYEALESGVVISSATQIFFSQCQGTIIGITGTKGKSTTSSLIHEVLSAGGVKSVLIGNIGKPALDYLEDIDASTTVVFELSSYQLSDLKVSPHIAVITNIYPEHLNWHDGYENYINSKANITLHQTENDYFIYNKDNDNLNKIALQTKAKLLFFSKDDISYPLLPKDFQLSGEFLINTVPAVLIGKMYNLTDDTIRQGFSNFIPLPHRLEYIGEVRGIRFYNDSLATIPQATISALTTLGNDIETLVAGGFDRGIDFSLLGQYLSKSSVKNLILFPTTAEYIWQSVLKSDPHTQINKFDVDNMQDAVKTAFETTSPGKICLLSPASSSFNLFRDYTDRGDQFKKFIQERS